MTRILCTGSRKLRDKAVVLRALCDVLSTATWPVVVVTGGQVSHDYKTGEPYGADYLFGLIAREVGLEVEEHPAHEECSEHGWAHSFARFGRPGGPIRNQVMVDKGADICIAIPMGKSPGTRGCMAKAEAAGIPVRDYGYE